MKNILTILLLLCIQLNAAEPQKFNKSDRGAEPGTNALFDHDEQTDMADIDQAGIIDKMIRYLQVNYRDTAVINKGGVCNGLAFLAQYYASLNLSDEFFVAMESMSSWDETKASLKAPSRIPYLYPTLGHLFEQWINDISWFQQTYVNLTYLRSHEVPQQKRRIQQFEMIKRSDDPRRLVLLGSPTNYKGLTGPQLAELLEIWSWYPNTIVEFGGSRHATSSRILSDGKIFYYDPNIPKRLKPFVSFNELSQVIQETKYKLLGFPHEKMDIIIMAYQYVGPGKQPYLPKAIQGIKQKMGQSSANGFTPLHLAVYANDIGYFRTLLQQPNVDPNKADKMGMTPLYLATQLWRADFVKELLKHPKININPSARLSPILAAIANYNAEVAAALINRGANLFVTPLEKLNMADLLQQNATSKLLDIPAVILCDIKQEELGFVKELCKKVPGLLQMRDAYGNDLLYYAALFENYALYEVLLNADMY